MPDPQRFVNDIEALKVYFDPFRKRIMAELITPHTIHEVAEVLAVPFTRLYYQFNLLEKHGFIEVIETRAMSGAVEEKVYQVTAWQYVVARELMRPTPDSDIPPGFTVILDTVLDETRHLIEQSVRDGRIDLETVSPDPTSILIRRGAFRLAPDQAQALHRELVELLTKYQAMPSESHDPFYGIALALFPMQLNTQPTDDEPPA